MTNKWVFTLLIASFAVGRIGAEEPIRLIAHRGGLVDQHHPENSVSSAEEAIRRGYWMLEMDLQESPTMGKRLEYRSHINSVEWLQLECDEVKKLAWHVREHPERCRYDIRTGPCASGITPPLPSCYLHDVTPKAQVPSPLFSEHFSYRIVEFTFGNSLG